MSEPILLPVKPGSLSAKDNTVLRRAGVIVIEHEAPETLRLLRPNAELDSSLRQAQTMLTCAVHALSAAPSDTSHSATKQRAAFVEGLAKALAAQSKELS